MSKISTLVGRPSGTLCSLIFDLTSSGVRVSVFNKLCYRNFFLLPNGCVFNASSQHLNANQRLTIKDSEEPSKPFWKQYRLNIGIFNTKKCTEKLAEILNCSVEEALQFLQNDRNTFFIDFDNTKNKIIFLIYEGIKPEFIKNNTWILKLPLADLKSRMNSFKNWDVDPQLYQEFTPLFKLPYVDFFHTSLRFIEEKQTVPYGNRIIYLSETLECSVWQVSERIIKAKNVLRKDFNLINNSLQAYYEFGFNKKDILNDLVCLADSLNKIYTRLNIAVKQDVQPLKTWFVRCPDDDFNRTLELYKMKTNAFLPYKNREDFLASVFDLSAESVEQLKKDYPVVEKMDGTKMRETIEFFMDSGYTKEQIISKLKPGILGTRLDLLKIRLSEFRTLGILYPSLWNLCTSESRYQYLVEQIIYNNSREDSD